MGVSFWLYGTWNILKPLNMVWVWSSCILPRSQPEIWHSCQWVKTKLLLIKNITFYFTVNIFSLWYIPECGQKEQGHFPAFLEIRRHHYVIHWGRQTGNDGSQEFESLHTHLLHLAVGRHHWSAEQDEWNLTRWRRFDFAITHISRRPNTRKSNTRD